MSQWSGLSATFKAQAKRKSYKPRIGIALTGINKYYSRGGEFTMEDNIYKDELISKPSLLLNSKMTGGLSTVNRLNINIDNLDLVSDLFVEGGSYANPENTAVKAYLVFDSGTTLLADSIQFFRGIIDDFPQINQKSLKISCTSIDKIIFKKIGDLVTNDDATSGYKVPEESLGRIKPIIYGGHRFAVNFTKDNNQLASNYSFNRESNVVEAIPLGGGRFLIANHEVNSINSDGDGIWLYDDELGRLVEVNDFTVVSTNPCIISVTGTETLASGTDGAVPNLQPWKMNSAGADFVNDGVLTGHTLIIETAGSTLGSYKIMFVNPTQLYIYPSFPEDNVTGLIYRIDKTPNFTDWRSPIGASTSDNWANINRLYDLSTATAATVTQVSGAGPNEELVTIEFEIFPYSLNVIKQAKLYVKGHYDDDDGAFDLAVNHSNGDTFALGRTNTTQFHTHSNDLDLEHLNNCHLGYIKGTSGNDGTATVYEVIQKVIYFKNITTDNMKIYFGGLGRKYGLWIDSRSGHQNNNGSGDLIENAAGVVESLMRDTLSLTTANINETAFNSASAGDLSASKLSFAITKRTESDKLINDILERVKSIGYFDYDDKFKMVVYKSTDKFTESGSDDPNNDDIFILDVSESGNLELNTRQFDEHPIIKDSFWIKKNPANQIVTDFTIDYYETYNGNFAHELTKNDADAILYHDENITKKFSHPYTKDQDTAQIWLTFLIDRLNRKHWHCGFQTFYQAIAKEMWDVVNIQHPVIENLFITDSYLTKKWRVISIDIQTDLGKISVELEEQ